MKVIIAILVLFALAAGGYWYMTQKTVVDDEATQVPETTQTGMPVPSTEDSVSETVVGGESVAATVREFTVTGSPFKFVPNELRVKEGETVRITFKNSGGTHDFVIDEFQVRTKQLQSGGEETLEFVANKKGTFEYYCSVGTHRQMGMKGSLVVE